MYRGGVWINVALVVTVLVVLYAYSFSPTCTPPRITKNAEGSQGYRIWSGETLKSFEHGGTPVCVPEGWEALGASERGGGWAKFDLTHTGVIIKSNAFARATLTTDMSDYVVTLVYPLSTPAPDTTEYESIATNAFNRIGALYGDDASHERRFHTVLVTSGLAGDTIKEGTRVYPDPGLLVSFIVRTPDQTRSEELTIHAVAHLYNRHRPDLVPIAEHQMPFSAGEWQELESTWAESVFIQSATGRKGRLDYMLNVHTAVMTKNFSLIQYPPFNDAQAFKKIVPTVLVPSGASYLDEQYGHYILAPLTMVAIDGLLIKEGKKTTVASLLHDIHVGKSTNFFDELKNTLTTEDYAQVDSWIRGATRIPADLVRAVSLTY